MTSHISSTRRCGSCGAFALEHARVPHDTKIFAPNGEVLHIHVDDLPVIRCKVCMVSSMRGEAFARLDEAITEECRKRNIPIPDENIVEQEGMF